MSANKYGLSSLDEDMKAIGLGPVSTRGGAPRQAASTDTELGLLESRLAAKYGGGGRLRMLARMNSLVEGAPSRGRQGQAPSRNRRAAVLEGLKGYHQTLAVPRPVPAALNLMAGSSRTAALAENVRRMVASLHEVNRNEATKAWANVALISETFRRRITRMGRAIGEQRLVDVGAQFGRLADKSAIIAKGLKEGRTVRNLPAMFSQAMGYVLAGSQLYAGLTEGAEAPFPVTPGKPGIPGLAMPPGQTPEGADPMGGDPMGTDPMGGSVPTQGVEGADPMADPNADPLGLGGGAPGGLPKPPKPGMPGMPQEGLDPDAPFYQGADDPDLDQDEGAGMPGLTGDGADGDADPLGLGSQAG